MNTKMLFLLLLSLFIVNGQSSIATANTKRSAIEVSTTNYPAPGQQDGPRDEVPPMDISAPRPLQKTLTPNSDDDGKHHHFHYDRITCMGCRRFLLLFLSKLVLVVSQVCCFIYCVTHVFH